MLLSMSSLVDLERMRDDLLMQLYHSDDSFADKDTVSYTKN